MATQFESYQVSRDTGEVFGFVRVLEYGSGYGHAVERSATVTRRSDGRTYSWEALRPMRCEIVGDTMHFPDNPNLKPVLIRVGRRELTSVGVARYKHKSAAAVAVWRCDCGRTGRSQLSAWRHAKVLRCTACGLAAKKALFSPVPATSYKERMEREVEALRRNPMRVA